MSRFRCMAENSNDLRLVLLYQSYNADIQIIAQSFLRPTPKNYLWIFLNRFCRNVRKSRFIFKIIKKSGFGEKYRKMKKKLMFGQNHRKSWFMGNKVEICRKKRFFRKKNVENVHFWPKESEKLIFGQKCRKKVENADL